MAAGVKYIHSHRTWMFKKMMEALPQNVKELAEAKYEIFKTNPKHPSFHLKVIEKTRNNPLPKYELRVTRFYRAVCFKDGDTYIWEWIGTHKDFDKLFKS